MLNNFKLLSTVSGKRLKMRAQKFSVFIAQQLVSILEGNSDYTHTNIYRIKKYIRQLLMY